MNPDDLKPAWQAQETQSRLTADPDQVLQEVQRTQRTFVNTIFWRDVQEVGASLLMVPVWIFLGITLKLPWTWYLFVPALIWIAGYMLVGRWNQESKPAYPGQPLRQHLEHTLAQVNYQIELLNKVFWWYLLPIALPMAVFFGHLAWDHRGGGWWTLLGLFLVLIIAMAVLGYGYWLNKYVVRTHLVPLRHELHTQLQCLGEETRDEYSEEGYSIG